MLKLTVKELVKWFKEKPLDWAFFLICLIALAVMFPINIVWMVQGDVRVPITSLLTVIIGLLGLIPMWRIFGPYCRSH